MAIPASDVTGTARKAQAEERATGRRVLAVVMPHFLSELVLENLRNGQSSQAGASLTLSSSAFAVVLTDREQPVPAQFHSPQDARKGRASLKGRAGWLPGLEGAAKEELQPKTRLDAVSNRARQFGVRAGQTIAEGRALLSELQICELARAQVENALERISDGLSKFANVVSFDVEANCQTKAVGTLWLDVTGIGHLFGGERSLAKEVAETVRSLGHHTRVAIANGPHLSQAFAMWPIDNQQEQVLSESQIKNAVPWLPITALPVEPAVHTWLARLGVLTFADLEKIPRKMSASRLGRGAGRALDLLQGKDDEPLHPYIPKALPKETISWDEPVTGSEPLLFALRGLTAKVGTRLDGRGLAAQRLRLTVFCDRAIARFRNADAEWVSDFELVSPLYRAEELWKVISARLSKATLQAPSSGLCLEVLELTHRHQRQLELSSADSKLDGTTPEKLAVLFGELAADIGRHNFGLLAVKDSHRPEQRSLLEPVGLKPPASTARSMPASRSMPANTVMEDFTELSVPFVPTRLFESPVQIQGELKLGALCTLEGALGGVLSSSPKLYMIGKFEFVQRISGIEWWSKLPASRDYYRAWFSNPSGGLDVLLFLDRTSGKCFVQGVYD